MEGKDFTLLPDFTPRPILCDNNLSALPVEYQEYIIDKYQKADVVLEDANSGFEPRTFDGATLERWKRINKGPWRFGYDEEKEEDAVYRMVQVLKNVVSYEKRVYVLIGNEPFESCMRRVNQVIEWGCEPYVQPFMALNAMTRTPAIRYDWTMRKLMDVTRWANKWVWRKIPYRDYLARYKNKKVDPESLQRTFFND